jgi:hypothetical protein
VLEQNGHTLLGIRLCSRKHGRAQKWQVYGEWHGGKWAVRGLRETWLSMTPHRSEATMWACPEHRPG